ncbi:hypothetical protein [Pseudomonas sp. zfem002]|uniref:hypothetical protein n=1 Tax=Pseudomonas sp. zfem002 TaxID=3078197 RepID=UPI002929A29D|nr:hypothetical protein [Pseudomonas sp. zfem002]MDU9393900.1 hypothetical protein [Pseudomonas sp. zfem002]
MSKVILGRVLVAFVCLLGGVNLPIASTIESADTTHCGYQQNDQAYKPVVWGQMTICFIYERSSLDTESDGLQSVDGIVLYMSSASGAVTRVREFSKVYTEEILHDAFLFPVNKQGELRLFVIHSNDTPGRWVSASRLYDVNAFELKAGQLVRDDLISDFFGGSGDYHFDGTDELRHVFPYKTRSSIEQVIESPLFKLVNSGLTVKGTLKEKTFLYKDRPFSDLHSMTSAYLIEDDEVTVTETSVGWCNITYSANAKPIKAWIRCDSMTVR